MAHYSSAYDYDAEEAASVRKKARKVTEELLEKALDEGESCAAEYDLFNIKIREAIYWLKNSK